MNVRAPRLAWFFFGVIAAALGLPQAYRLWLETRTFTALDMPVSLSKGVIRTPDFPVNLKGWYHLVIWVDSDFSGCGFGLSHVALLSRSTVYSNGSPIESSDGIDRYLGHFYARGNGRFYVAVEAVSDPTCLNPGHPRIGVWTDSSSYVGAYDEMRDTGFLIAIICLGLIAYAFFSAESVIVRFN